MVVQVAHELQGHTAGAYPHFKQHKETESIAMLHLPGWDVIPSKGLYPSACIIILNQ